VRENETTLLAELVAYHAPYDLAYVILHPEKWDDTMLESVKRKIARDEKLLKLEKKKRKAAVKGASTPPPKVEETDEEANKRFISEKIAENEKLTTKSDDDAELPDDFEFPS
jgi:hypothetical protein